MKRILVVIVALVAAQPVFSQVKFGIKAGVNSAALSDVKNGDSYELYNLYGFRTGFHGGAFTNISFGKHLGVQPEFLFSMQGGDSRRLGGADEKVMYAFNYLNLPLMLEFKPFGKLGILVGPQFGLNISRSVTTKLEGISVTFSGSDFDDLYKLEFEDNPFHKLDIGLVAGLQYVFIDHLTVGVRYCHGFTDTFALKDYYGECKGWRNSVIQFSAGWVF